MKLYVTGERIPADATVVCSFIDGKAYRAGSHAGAFIGNAAEDLREGFRVCVRDGGVREDDA